MKEKQRANAAKIDLKPDDMTRRPAQTTWNAFLLIVASLTQNVQMSILSIFHAVH